jgi:hypothetical protein
MLLQWHGRRKTLRHRGGASRTADEPGGVAILMRSEERLVLAAGEA